MPQSDVTTWLQFALQQIAAESYLDGPGTREEILQLGNNRVGFPANGFTRMTALQAEQFTQRYQIVDHHANDATGFSATLMKDQTTGEYTLSFRSLEYQDQAQGGDWERDGQGGAAGEIAGAGFALSQLVSMERYYQELKSSGKLPTGAVLNVTGYSLGGHLATVFTELHSADIQHTYTFNAAGQGLVGGITPVLTEAIRIQQLIDAMDAKFLEFDPTGALTRSGSQANVQTLAWYQPAVIKVAGQFATTGTASLPTGGLLGGVTRTDGAFSKITQLFGHASSGVDVELVANSGVHGRVSPILIEGQPLVESLRERDYGNSHSITLLVDSLALQELFQEVDPTLTQPQMEAIFKAASDASAGVFGQTHIAEGDTLELALDALRKVFLDVGAPPTNFNDNAGGFGDLTFRNEFYTHLAEVEAQLATTFAGQIFQIGSLVGQPVNDIGAAAEGPEPTSLAYRFALKELNPFVVLGSDAAATQTLYNRHNETGELALVNPDTGVGELTPQYLIDRAAFLAKKIEVNSNTFTSLNFTHFKDNTLADEITPTLALHQMLFGDGTISGGLLSDQLYGGSGGDQLNGGAGIDYLEGNRGDDTLDGGSGADTMLGGQGNDIYIVDNVGDVVREYANSGIDTVQSSVTFTLDSQVENLTLTGTADLNGTGNELNNDITGNSGVNRLEGMGGIDHLIGGDKNDILIGGIGDDRLEGGAGFDTYIYNAGDGTDRIEDSDADGEIIFNGKRLLFGIHHPDDPNNTYYSPDRSLTYVLSGTDLIVNGVLTVNENFQSGQFGIDLVDRSNDPTSNLAINYNNGQPTTRYDGDATNNIPDFSAPANHEAYGYGGNDTLDFFGSSAAFNHQVFGGDGEDLVNGGAGHDRIRGEAGRDLLRGWDGQDVVDGGMGEDALEGNSGNDVLLGGDGIDYLGGDDNEGYGPFRPVGNDYLDGGSGADRLWGGLGDDVLVGGTEADRLYGDNVLDAPLYRYEIGIGVTAIGPHAGIQFFSVEGGSDYLDGGEGDDYLQGDGGDDILLGGADNDTLYGDDQNIAQVQEGDDLLDGGDGVDLLVGGGGADSLSGGDGDDQLVGDYLNATGPNEGDDILDGGAGNDLLLGGGGNDELFGGTGDDSLGGEDGDDFLDGSEGDDELQGGLGDDVLLGGSGDDLLFGQEGNDALFGDEGDDELQGNEGDDLLGGDAGDDRLFGGVGVDTLFGDEGDDTLHGGDDHDVLVGGAGFDILIGEKGDDDLIGGTGFDGYVYNLGDGHDTITDTVRNGAENLIQFGPGMTLQSLTFLHDPLQQTLTIQVAGGGSIRLLGFDPNTFNYVVDSLTFTDGTVVSLADQVALPDGLVEGTDESNVIRTGSLDDTIFAGAGSDALIAGAGNDTLLGEGGNDNLIGGDGNDFLDGGVGSDQLAGGAGSDTFVFAVGSGQDTVFDARSEDRLQLGHGFTAGNLTAVKSGNDLVLKIAGASDQLTLTSHFQNPSNQLGQIVFADGTVWDNAALNAEARKLTGTGGADYLEAFDDGNFLIRGLAGDDTLIGHGGADGLEGGTGADVLIGNDGQDVLDGGTGNDRLDGGAGHDTYRYSLGDGFDQIIDQTTSGEPNQVVFGSGISSVGLRYRIGNGLELPIGLLGEGLSLGFQNVSDLYNSRAVDQFHFADGTTLTHAQLVDRGIDVPGTEFDDFLFGTNARDLFAGGLGNDTLSGGAGDDRYAFNTGDGIDTIEDLARPGEGNSVVFGPGIASSDLTLGWQAPQFGFGTNKLLVRVGSSGDALLLDSFNRGNVLGPHAVDSYRFADGTVLSYGELIARGFDLTGTTGNDVLAGTSVVDRLNGLAGNDILQGGDGNDVLDGGAGDDQLQGGQGDDRYLFGRGGGHDRLVDLGGTNDTIQFAADLAPTDVQVTKNGKDVVLTIADTGETLTLMQFFTASLLQIDAVRFADGTVWDAATVAALAERPIVGTAGADSLTGTVGDDVLRGLADNDQLLGLGGHDLLDGGAGADVMAGGAGNDTYVVDDAGDAIIEAAGEGLDRVQSSVTYQLSANVENLTLTGTAGINGTGNQLNNVLTGNSGANVLAAGVGDDTYVVGVGDTVIEQAGEGRDTVQTSQTYTLGANLENLTLTGSAPIDGTGNDLDNVLVGNASVNVLTGGKGNDTFVVSAGDVVVERAGEGIDTIQTTRSYRLGAHVENLTFLETAAPGFDESLGGAPTPDGFTPAGSTSIYGGTAASVQLGVGNELDNVLVGNDQANVFEGGLGNDTLSGKGGFDVLRGEGGQDTYLFGFGSGLDVIDDTIAGEVDTIQIAAGIRPDQVTVSRQQLSDSDASHYGNRLGLSGLFLTLPNLSSNQSGSSDQLIVLYSSLTDFSTKQVRFADGTTWDAAILLAKSASQPDLDPGPGITLDGGPTDDVLIGGSANDQLNGLAGDDRLEGQEGNDILSGGAGSDLLLGGPGHDLLSGGSAADASGVDRLFGGDGHDNLIGSGGNNELDGGEGNDYLVSWGGADVLRGGAGNDTLQAGAGDDVLDGGAGNDDLQGDAGADTFIFGRGYGRDFASAFSDDTIALNPDVNPSDITLATDGYFSFLRLNGTSDELTMSPDAGRVVFADGTIWDHAYLLSHRQFIGTDGPDFISGTSGAESLVGGRGNDLYTVTAGDLVLELPGEGRDGIGTRLDYALPEHVEDLRLLAVIPGDPTSASQAVLGVGNDLDNVIEGNPETPIFGGGVASGDNILDGGAGNDVLIGGTSIPSFSENGDGSDLLIGGSGNDVLRPFYMMLGSSYFGSQESHGIDLLLGGPGDDTYILIGGYTIQSTFEPTLGPFTDLPNAVVVELPDEGSDTVVVLNDHTLAANVENLYMFGGNLGVGNDSDNVLIGSRGANRLEGGAGADTLIGGFGRTPNLTDPLREIGTLLDDSIDDGMVDTLLGGIGNDVYVVGAGDVIVEQAEEGIDTVVSRLSVVLGDNLEQVRLAGDAAINATGNALVNVMIGNSAGNVIAGGAGNDSLHGEAGDDTYVFNVGDGFDTIEDVAAVGEGNRIQFGAGITQANLTITQDQAARTLTIQVGSSGTDKLVLTNFDPTGANGSLVAETLAFADGSTANLASLLSPGVITGTAGNDVLTGTTGNDTIIGGAGNDQLSGRAGNDTYIFNVGDGVDTITDMALPGEGNTLQFGPGIDPTSLSLGLGSLLIHVGTTGDAIHLTNFDPTNVLGPRTIETFRFADGTVLSYDQLVQRGFDLTGTAGNDTITGTNVVDRISGLAGDDTLVGGAGDDSLAGGAGTDQLDGGPGADQMTGGVGDDTYVIDASGDVVIEALNEGTDSVQSSLTYTLGANVENLILTSVGAVNGTGNVLDNVLIGNSAANLLDGGNGADTLIGGAGDDTYVVDNVGDVVTEQANEGIDTVQSSVTYTLGTNVENLTLTSTANLTGIGNALNNVLTGNSGNNLLDGGLGADTLRGGQGDDTYIVDNVGDVVTEQANEGADIVQSAITYTLGANLENLTLTGTAAINGTGNALDNILTGNSANNVLTGGAGDDQLDGGAGADTLVGGTGNDTYVVDAAGDVVAELANEGTDTVQSSVTYTLGANVENLTLTGTANLNGTGNALDNILTGNSAANVLTGGAGSDTLIGGQGNDTYLVDNTSDTVTEQANEGLDSVQSSVTYTLGANIENLTLTGTAAINGTGNALNNVLTGNSVANTLTGGAGNDTLDGGAGADTLIGGLGDDTFVVDNVGDVMTEQVNEGIDTVQSSVTYTLGANVENLTLTGTANINGTGNSLDNILIGNSGANVLTGGAGNDTYVVGAGDTVIENTGAGTDTVQSSVTWTLSLNVENLTLTGTANINGTGSSANNILIGNSGANTLDGGAGNDSVDGGDGNDSLLGGSGDDTLLGGLGDDTLNAGSGNDLLDGGDGADSLDGGSGDDQLLGGVGNDTLTGGSGADQFTGGTGNDVLTGGSGNDLYNFSRGDGQDTISDADPFPGNQDRALFGATINPLDLVISRQANDLRVAIHGSSDQITVQNWYVGTTNRIETIQAGNGQALLSTQVDQLIQAMAAFSQQSGLSWDQAIDQRPQEVQTVLAANWQ